MPIPLIPAKSYKVVVKVNGDDRWLSIDRLRFDDYMDALNYAGDICIRFRMGIQVEVQPSDETPNVFHGKKAA